MSKPKKKASQAKGKPAERPAARAPAKRRKSANEATLEATSNRVLRDVFPALFRPKVHHQKTFVIRLGRQEIQMSKRRSLKQGRLDSLLLVEDRPLAVLELKKPGLPIDDDDGKQALSYARLVSPMPPLAIVSNGIDTRFYKTITGERWEPKDGTLDEQTVGGLFQGAMEIAEADLDNAVKTLLGRDSDLLAEAMQRVTKDQIRKLEADENNSAFPLANNLRIPREGTAETIEHLSSGLRTIGIVGPPLSGKTNVLAAIAAGLPPDKWIPLFINCEGIERSPLQYMAEIFAREFFRRANADDIRHWLRHGIAPSDQRTLVVIFNGPALRPSTSTSSEFAELLELSAEGRIGVVLEMEEATLRSLTRTPGRNTLTPLGRQLRAVRIGYLNNNEFSAARKLFHENFRCQFELGSEFTFVYRHPRILRMLAAMIVQSKSKAQDHTVVLANPPVSLLAYVWAAYVPDPRLRDDLRRIAKAFVIDGRSQIPDHSVSLASFGRGHIRLETANEVLPPATLERLHSQGHIQYVNGPGQVLILPKTPELLAAAGAYEVADAVLNSARTQNEEAAYNTLIRASAPFPLADLVGAFAIQLLVTRDTLLAESLARRLLDDPPQINSVSQGMTAVLNPFGNRELEIDLPADPSGRLMGNVQPWLILSNLATVLDISTEEAKAGLFRIIEKVGGFRGLLRFIDELPISQEMPFQCYEFVEWGNLPAPQMGVIEPIMRVLQDTFQRFPNDMIEFCRHAVETQNGSLVWRLHSAIVLLHLIHGDASSTLYDSFAIVQPFVNEMLLSQQITPNDATPDES